MNGASRAAGLLAFATLAAYWNSFAGVFQFDDYKVIVGDPAVRSWDAWLGDLGRGIRPLLKLTYTANWTSGLGLAGFHAANLLIHWGTALLVFVLSRRLALRWLPDDGADRAALLAALLFAIHPVHTEAVTYVSGRSSSLMTLLLLAALACYAHPGLLNSRHSRASGNPGEGHGAPAFAGATASRLLRHAASPLFFALAVATKETAMIFPLALVIWDLASGEGLRGAWRRHWTHWLVCLAAVLAVLLHGRYAAMLVEATGALSAGGHFATQLHGFLYLLSRLVRADALNIDPDLPAFAACGARCGVELGAVIALAAGAWVAARRRPWWTFAIAWLLVHVLLLNLAAPRLDVANERQLYPASWPLLLALSIEATRLASTRPDWAKWVRAAAGAALVALAAATVARNADYRSEIALWQDTARKSPGKARVWNNLGYAYQLAGRAEDARSTYRRALEIDPGHPEARANLDRQDGR